MNDLISRQMAIDGFYEMASDMDYLCTVSDYVSFLESLPSAQPYTDEEIQKMQDIEQAQLDKAYEMGKADALRWIPCNERLPNKADHTDDMVLVCYRNGSVRFNTYMNGWAQGNPVAWMLLPEPYKEK